MHNYDFPMWFIRFDFKPEKSKSTTKKKATKKKTTTKKETAKKVKKRKIMLVAGHGLTL